MVGTPRKGPSRWPDRRPKPPPVLPLPLCARCGLSVSGDERADGEQVRHLVCDVAQRRTLARRIEATRAIHRLISALASVPAIERALAADIAGLPDACDVPDALAFLERARTLVECSSDLGAQQRRIAISLLDATARKLGG
jgi:hypothetical protein